MGVVVYGSALAREISRPPLFEEILLKVSRAFSRPPSPAQPESDKDSSPDSPPQPNTLGVAAGSAVTDEHSPATGPKGSDVEATSACSKFSDLGSTKKILDMDAVVDDAIPVMTQEEEFSDNLMPVEDCVAAFQCMVEEEQSGVGLASPLAAQRQSSRAHVTTPMMERAMTLKISKDLGAMETPEQGGGCFNHRGSAREIPRACLPVMAGQEP
ncbi:uncharacterized protein LOC119339080 [Triticum dicoccoides]|uniref:uncharacterized protein LOC119339080 n=1 Tax=Triticum dicoccoides TaxID=85692 RepID=UPI001891079A|nr:uncharacterized protein LOC119339080 [Triticum dicoccoides]